MLEELDKLARPLRAVPTEVWAAYGGPPDFLGSFGHPPGSQAGSFARAATRANDPGGARRASPIRAMRYHPLASCTPLRSSTSVKIVSIGVAVPGLVAAPNSGDGP